MTCNCVDWLAPDWFAVKRPANLPRTDQERQESKAMGNRFVGATALQPPAWRAGFWPAETLDDRKAREAAWLSDLKAQKIGTEKFTAQQSEECVPR